MKYDAWVHDSAGRQADDKPAIIVSIFYNHHHHVIYVANTVVSNFLALVEGATEAGNAAPEFQAKDGRCVQKQSSVIAFLMTPVERI